MKVNLQNQEYFEVKLNPQKDAVRFSIKTKLDEESYGIITCEVHPKDVDSVITELIKFKSELKNVKV
jgi:hypothetical protein